jgi:phospholipase/carboxylesterase
MVLTSNPIQEAALGLKFKYTLGASPDAPCVFMVHGRAGNYDVMWAFRRCIPEGSSIIAPQAPLVDPIGGFSWWLVRPDWPKEEGVEMATLLVKFIKDAPFQLGLNPRKLVVIGFSQGGAILSLCVQICPNLFSGLGLLASFTIKHPTTEADLTGLPVFIGHGSKDETVPLDKAMRGADFLRERGTTLTLFTDDVGHKLGTGAMRGLKDWLVQILS